MRRGILHRAFCLRFGPDLRHFRVEGIKPAPFFEQCAAIDARFLYPIPLRVYTPPMLLPILLALATGPHCIDGYYDLGEKAAALGFACATDEDGKNIGANIRFCNREELLKDGTCSGREDIPCTWQEEAQGWWCHGENFDAAVVPVGEDSLSYHFKTSASEGDLAGKRVPLTEGQAGN
jgi:hypothetical protein